MLCLPVRLATAAKHHDQASFRDGSQLLRQCSDDFDIDLHVVCAEGENLFDDGLCLQGAAAFHPANNVTDVLVCKLRHVGKAQTFLRQRYRLRSLAVDRYVDIFNNIRRTNFCYSL